MTQTHFRCHDADACKFGQAPCPTPYCCGCPVTHEGYTPAGAMMQIEEPEAKPSLQALHALILDGDLTKAARMCDQLLEQDEARDFWMPVGFAWGLCGAAIAVIFMKVFA